MRFFNAFTKAHVYFLNEIDGSFLSKNSKILQFIKDRLNDSVSDYNTLIRDY
jgi:hypothetical protein